MTLTADSKLKDIALSSPEARLVLEDAGIDYCCGGGKSLREACPGAGVSAEEILDRVRRNSRGAGSEAANWSTGPLNGLTRHIRDTHHQYVRSAIPRIGTLLEKVKAKHGSAHPEIGKIQELFTQVGQEMTMHMQKEELLLFPYIEQLQQSIEGNGPLEPPFFQTVRNPVQTMLKEHDDAGDLIKQIRNTSANYTPPADACASFQALYEDLKRFEADLHLHVHLENNILFPRAVEAETACKP